MPSPLTQAGALNEPSRYAPLHTNRYFTGLWTQRSPLRDAAVPYLYEKFYSGSRFESLWDGLNTEITAKLTLARRAGCSVYNNQNFPPINRFAKFRTFSGATERIRIMADCKSANVAHNIVSVNVFHEGASKFVTVIFDSPHQAKVGTQFTFSGLTTAVFLNGQTVTVSFLPNALQITAPFVHADYGPAADTGVGTAMQAMIYDATGPSTKLAIFAKDPTAGSTYFQFVGNTLYFGDGVEAKKWLQSAKAWAAAAQFNAGDFLVDTNLNIQVAVGAVTALIQSVSLTANVGTVIFQSKISTTFYVGMQVTFSGLTSATWLNGQLVTITSVSYNTITFAFVHANYASASDTGQAATANGLTGGVQPTWNSQLGGVTIDNGQQWICKGDSVQNWGIAAPTVGPSVANAAQPTPYPNWAANTWYSPFFVIVDSNNNIQQLTRGGVTGGVQPTWSVVPGVVTADNTAQWTCVGPSAWAAATNYALNRVVAVTFTYWVTVPNPPQPCFSGNVRVNVPGGLRRFEHMPSVIWVETNSGPRMADLIVHDFDGVMIDMGNGELVTFAHLIERDGEFVAASEVFSDEKQYPRVPFKGKVYNLSIRTANPSERNYKLSNGWLAHNMKSQPDPNEDNGSTSYPVTVTEFFQCTTPGLSGGSQPGWQDGVGLTVADNGVVWTNIGNVIHWTDIGAGANVDPSPIVIDSNGAKEQAANTGKSAGAPPAWATTQGQTTVDGSIGWLNAGNFSAAGTKPQLYGFAFKNSVSGEVSTMSPPSNQITVAANKLIAVQGQYSSDPQVDIIQIYRTPKGGSTYELLDEIPNSSLSGIWNYNDASQDSNLFNEILAQVDNANDPPPAAIAALTFHLGRMWGAVGNVLYRSNVDSTNGATNSCFRPIDNFVFPSRIVRLWSTSIGLLVFTVSDVYIVLGLGTASSLFYPASFYEGLGLMSYDAFTVNGSTAHLMTQSNKVVSLDPGAGLTEEGFPIGDIFEASYNSSTAFVTWHEGSSGETALYVADAATGYYRMAPASAPESSTNVWSPRAIITGGVGAVQSLEVTPGLNRLLMSSFSTGPILYRDKTVNTDNGSTFVAYATFGSIVMAQSGQVADLEWIMVESMKVGTRPLLGILLGEISGKFETVRRTRQDPPLLPPSKTIWNDRYVLSQNQNPTYCRHFQLKVLWAAEDAHNELLSSTIYGALMQERR